MKDQTGRKLHIGDRVWIYNKFVREQTGSDAWWKNVALERSVLGYYVGRRVIYSGKVMQADYDQPAYLQVKRSHSVALVVTDERKAPFYADSLRVEN